MLAYHRSTPQADGFWMPGEFAPHAGCWLLWPERPDVWRENGRPAQKAFAAVATSIAQFEPVTIGVSPALLESARALLHPSVRLVALAYDDAWVRDSGPTFVVNKQGEVRGIDWGFNAWGGREEGAYYPWGNDEKVAQFILSQAETTGYKANFIMEGGSLHVDGEGTLITTAECLLNPNRNPELSQSQIEEALRQYLGVQKIIWIPRGVFNDETNGHVDNLVCFARPGEVILSWTDDQHDPQYEISHEAYEILSRTPDAQGRPLKIYKLHQPSPLFVTPEEAEGIQTRPGSIHRHEGKRMAASYVNFYMPNGGIVMPLFGDHVYDVRAVQMLRTIFPDRRVVGVPSREILLGGGNIHCITQQQPAPQHL